MTPNDIEAFLEELAARFIDLGYFHPLGYFKITNGRRYELFFMAQRTDRYDPNFTESFSAYGDTIEQTIQTAKAKMDEVEPRDKRQKETFVKQIGHILEEARELGLDQVANAKGGPQINYVGWLEAMMKSLSENVIEDKSREIAAE